MGTIYKVHHNLLDEVRVIKFMRAAVTGDADLHRRFLQEAKLVTRFKHPNIAAVYDFAMDDDDTAYIVMEYVSGLNLNDATQLLHPLSVPFVLELIAQTLEALGYLHRKNVVHRDISPDNIMAVVEDGAVRVKLIDLGIAKALDSTDGVTKTGFFLGKLKYASPEQLGALTGDDRLDGRADLYSLGVVLYELLTGRLPFSAASAQSLIAGHLCEAPAPFTVSDPQERVPEIVRSLVLKTLAKDRAARFESAEEMRLAVLDTLGQLPSTPILLDTERLAKAVLAQEELHAATQPASPSAQERMNRRFNLAETTPRPGSGSLAPGPNAATVEARQGTKKSWSEPPGSVTTISTTGADATVAIGSTKRRGWIVPASAGAAAVACAILLLVIRTRNADPLPPGVPSGTTAVVSPASASPEPAVRSVPSAAVDAVSPAAAEPLSSVPEERDAPLRLAAQEARTLSAAARSSAIATQGDALPQFRSGSSALREGDALAAQGSFGPAITKFTEASRHFQSAASIARRDAQRATRPAPAESARQAPPAPIEEPARLPGPTATREPEPVRATPPITQARPAAEEPVQAPATSAEAAVRAAIREFVAAQEALDAGRYVAIFPSADRSRITAAFQSFRTQQLEMAIENIEISGSRATVRAREERVAVPRVGSVQRVNASRTIRLERDDGRWVVVAIN